MKRPLRDSFENNAEKIPSGPLGFTGDGEAVGAIGYFLVESAEVVTDFIPGVKRPGFSVVSHSIDRKGDGETHTLEVNAISKDVAKFAAKYESSPSNLDFIKSSIEVIEVVEIRKRSSYSLYEIVVEVKTGENNGR